MPTGQVKATAPTPFPDEPPAGGGTNWTAVRKAKEGEITADILAFLTAEPSAEVAPIHPKAMPVVLSMVPEVEIWLNAPAHGCARRSA